MTNAMEITKKKFLKNMVGFSMMTWITFALGFIASPIATRLFVPDELGKINMFSTYASLVSSFCYLGLDQAFVRYYREPPQGGTRGGMYAFCTLAALSFSVLLSLMLFFFWPRISNDVIGAPDLGVYLCLCLFGFSSIIYRFLSLGYRMEQNAKLYTIQGVLYVLVTKLGYLSVGFGSARAKPAILLLTLMVSVFTLVFLFIQRKRFDFRLKGQISRPFVREIGAYAAPLIPITAISWLESSVGSMALRQLMGFAALGIYTSALGIASTINIIQSGFNTYWAPYVFENYQCDEKRRFDTVHRQIACALTIFGLAITLLQTPVFLLLGKDFRSSVIFFPFLFLSPICYCLSETTCIGIDIAKKTYWNTLLYAVTVAGNVGLCFLLIPRYGATGAAMASAFSGVMILALRTIIGQHYYRAIESYRYLFYTVGLMLFASFANWLLNDQPLVKYAVLALTLLIALVLFRRELALYLRTGRELLGEGRRMLRRRRGDGEGVAR